MPGTKIVDWAKGSMEVDQDFEYILNRGEVMIRILTGFDGSSPHYPSAVERKGEAKFLLYPARRRLKGISEEARGAGARFSTRIENTGARKKKVIVCVDWESARRMRFRDIGHVRHDGEDDWTMIPARVSGTVSTYTVAAAPGITHLGYNPEYNCGQLRDFLHALPGEAKVRSAGKSREGRDMWLVHLPSKNRGAPAFFLQTRDHPYETAGSYCTEGIILFLLSSDPVASYLRSKFDFFFMPMTNPDGVYNGMSRLTWERGADLNRARKQDDAAWRTVRKTLDSIRPSAYMNIHNWQSKFIDGLLCNEEDIAARIRYYLPGDRDHFKRWTVQTQYDYLKAWKLSSVPDSARSWKDHVKDAFNGQGCTYEFPWFGLNTTEMRAKGVKAMVAFALSVIEAEEAES